MISIHAFIYIRDCENKRIKEDYRNMARISKEERLRQEGMAQAYRIAQTRGIDGLKKEIEIRKLTGIPVGISPSALEESVRRIKENTIDTVNI